MDYVIPILACTEAKHLIRSLCDQLDVLEIAIDSVSIDLRMARNVMTRMTTSPLVAAARAHRYATRFQELKRFCNKYITCYKSLLALALINKDTYESVYTRPYADFINSWSRDIKIAVFPNKVSL